MQLCGQWVIDEGGLFVGHGGFPGKGRRADTHTHTHVITLNKGNELRTEH